MQQFLLKFEKYCQKPGVTSNKASSYAKAIQYLCEYLGISVIDIQTISQITAVESELSNKQSHTYLALLKFLENRQQKSYLEGGFIKAALKQFYGFIADSVTNTHQTGQFDSWEIIDEHTAIKHCDKSFFDYRGSGVPKGICWFFGAEDMDLSESRAVKLIFNGVQYHGNVKNESTDRRRVRIFWSTELGNLFNAYNEPGMTATFKRIASDTYAVSLEGGEKGMEGTVLDNIIKSLEALGGKGTYAQIYEMFERITRQTLTDGRKAGIRASMLSIPLCLLTR